MEQNSLFKTFYYVFCPQRFFSIFSTHDFDMIADQINLQFLIIIMSVL